MKKQLMLFLVLGGLFITGCSQVEKETLEQSGDRLVTFRPLVGSATRAQETTGSNLTSIKVHAYGATLFADTYTGIANGSSKWNSTTKHFWPASGEVKFVSYAPVPSTGAISITGTEQKLTGFSPKAEIENQEDLVVSYNKGDKTTLGSTGVPLNFKHALSQIVVKGKNERTDMKVEVKGIKLGWIPSKGDFVFPQVKTDGTYTLPRMNWSNVTTNADYVAKDGATVITLDNTGTQDLMFSKGGAMLIPQQLTKWNPLSPTTQGAYIGVLCKISDISGGNNNQLYPDPAVASNAGKFAFVAVGIGTEWKPGKKYVYTLDFTNGYGHVAPNQDDGETPTPGPNPGDPVLDSPIQFTVEVSNWDPEDTPLGL